MTAHSPTLAPWERMRSLKGIQCAHPLSPTPRAGAIDHLPLVGGEAGGGSLSVRAGASGPAEAAK